MASTPVVTDLLAGAAEDHGDGIAVVDDDGSITYAELLDRAASCAAGLLARGVRPGDRVALQLPNGIGWFVAYWGSALAGAIVVPLDARSRPAEVAEALQRCQAAALITVQGVETGSFDGVALGADGPDPADRDDQVHLIMFTSGTTGHPKGAMLSHHGLVANATVLAEALGVGMGEALLVPSPLSHVLGLATGCLVPTLVGGTLLTMSAFDGRRALELIARHRPVGMTGTPAHYLSLVEHPDRADVDTSSLRFAMYGGAPLTPEVARRIMGELGVPALLGGFGMTETSGGVTSASPRDTFDRQIGTLGRVLPTFTAQVVDPETGSVQSPGAVGELCVRGEGVMVGYWNEPDETASAFTDTGWLRTGDLVTLDADGYLRYVSRLKDMFTVGGYNVYPAEVERTLAGHPAVAESVVVGIPHARLGEVPFAFVRLHHGAHTTGAELEALCRDRLSSYKVPRRYAFRESFPLTPSGKVQRHLLRLEAQAEHPPDQ